MKATQKDWLDGQWFARVPEAALLDSRIGPRQFKLLCLLILHAKADGVVWPGQDRLAEMLGFFKKSGEPDDTLVSKLLSWSHSDKSPGLGLVQLGYVKKLGWIAGRETQSYQLCVPQISAADFNKATDRKLSNAEFAEKRAAKKRTLTDAAATKVAEKDEMPSKPCSDVFVFDGDEYTRAEVQLAVYAGEGDTIPRIVVEHFGYRPD